MTSELCLIGEYEFLQCESVNNTTQLICVFKAHRCVTIQCVLVFLFMSCLEPSWTPLDSGRLELSALQSRPRKRTGIGQTLRTLKKPTP